MKSLLLSMGDLTPEFISKNLLNELGYKSAILLNPNMSNTKSFFLDDLFFLNIGTSYIPRNRDINRNTDYKISNEDLICSRAILARYSELYRASEKKTVDSTIYRIFDFCLETLISNNTSIAIFPMIPHQNIEYFFYLAAKSLSIRVIFDSWLPKLKNRPVFYFYSDEMNSFGSRFRILLKNSKDSYQESVLNIYYDTYTTLDNSSNIVQEFETLNRNKFEFKRIIVLVIKFFNYSKQKGVLSSFEKTFKSIISVSFRIFNNIREDKTLRYLNFISLKEYDKEIKFIYFPLHYQPEATTVPAGGIFYNQFQLISQISKELPSNYYLFVKEHPTYWKKPHTSILNSRSMLDYKIINSLDNVYLIDNSINTYKLIKDSICVLTITGTVALEALANGKYSINFGYSPYNSLINSVKINSPKELEKALILISKTFDPKYEFKRVINTLDEIIFYDSENDLNSLQRLKFQKLVYFINKK